MAQTTSEPTVRLRRPIALLFPPQPLKASPMPAVFLAASPRLAALHAEVLASVGWDAPARRETALTWPLEPSSVQQARGAHVGTVAFSWAMTQILAEAGISPHVVFGHSLGLHTALAVTGAAKITDTLEVVDRTAQFLSQTHAEVSGAMLAVTGFTPDEIETCCENTEPKGTVFPAIINSRRQVVVSGFTDSVKSLEKCLRGKQAWGLTPVSGHLPLHTPLMAPLGDACARLMEGMRCHVPHVRLIHPTTGSGVQTVSNVELLWRTHLLGLIDFVHVLDEMERSGVASYIEVGIGDTLTRLGRWYRRDLPVFSTDTPEQLERILHAPVE